MFKSLSQESLEGIAERVFTMRQQESYGYRYGNYINDGISLMSMNDDEDESLTTLNAAWREKIVHWSYNVVDHFNLKREVVAISLDYFDRFLATRNNQCTGNLALLTSLTTLYMAVKLHDPKKVRISTLANLSRGKFGPEHIERMEWTLLQQLQWKLHPPTSVAFAIHLLCFLPTQVQPSIRKELLELSRYLTELVVCDMYFIPFDKSSIALAAILNVMEDIGFDRFPLTLRELFLERLADRFQLLSHSAEVVSARERMKAAFSSNTSSADKNAFNDETPKTPAVIVDETLGSGGSRTNPSPNSTVNSHPVVVTRSSSTNNKPSKQFRCASPLRRVVVTASPVGRMRSSPLGPQ